MYISLMPFQFIGDSTNSSLIGQTLQNIRMDQTEVILVVPKWPAQPWYDTFQGMLSQEPYVGTPHKGNLLLPEKSEELHLL